MVGLGRKMDEVVFATLLYSFEKCDVVFDTVLLKKNGPKLQMKLSTIIKTCFLINESDHQRFVPIII